MTGQGFSPAPFDTVSMTLAAVTPPSSYVLARRGSIPSSRFDTTDGRSRVALPRDPQTVHDPRHALGFSSQGDCAIVFCLRADGAGQRDRGAVGGDVDRARLDEIVERHLRLDLAGQLRFADGLLHLRDRERRL